MRSRRHLLTGNFLVPLSAFDRSSGGRAEVGSAVAYQFLCRIGLFVISDGLFGGDLKNFNAFRRISRAWAVKAKVAACVPSGTKDPLNPRSHAGSSGVDAGCLSMARTKWAYRNGYSGATVCDLSAVAMALRIYSCAVAEMQPAGELPSWRWVVRRYNA